MGRKRVLTEEERIAHRRETNRRWRQKNAAKVKEWNAARRKRIKERRASDPDFDREYRRRQRENAKRWLARLKVENPDEYRRYMSRKVKNQRRTPAVGTRS